MIILHKKETNEYSNNGLGALDKWIINPEVHWMLNGEFTFSFGYDLKSPLGKDIKNDMQIEILTEKLSNVFRIKRIEKSMGYLSVYCEQKSYDLIDNFVEDTNIVKKTADEAMQQISRSLQFPHPFNLRANKTNDTVQSARIVRKSALRSILDDQASNSIVNRWGGEIERSYNNITLKDRIGQDRGVKIEYRKDLISYSAKVDTSSVVTRIMPIGFNGLLLPEKYIDSPLIELDAPKISLIKFEDVKAAIGEYADDEDAIPLEDAYQKLRQLAELEFKQNHIDLPTSSYTVDFVNLSNTEEYKDYEVLQTVKGGDTLKIEHVEDDFVAVSRVVEFTFDPLREEYLEMRLGDIEASLTNSIPTAKDVASELDLKELSEPIVREVLNTVRQSADGEKSIFTGPDRPTANHINDIWYETLANNEIVMHKWTGTDWEQVFDSREQSVLKSGIEEAKKQANEAKELAETAEKKIDLRIARDSNGNPTGIVVVGDDGKESILMEVKGNKVQLTDEHFYIENKLITHEMLADSAIIENLNGKTLDFENINGINLDINSGTIGTLNTDRVSIGEGSAKATLEEFLNQLNANNGDLATRLEQSTNALSSAENKLNELEESYKQTLLSSEATEAEINNQLASLEEARAELEQAQEETKANLQEVEELAKAVTRTFNTDSLGRPVISKADSDVKLVLDNDKLSFVSQGSELAYFGKDKAYISALQILQNLNIGKYTFEVEADGGFSIRWID